MTSRMSEKFRGISNTNPVKGLVTYYGEGAGATKQEGEHVKFCPNEKWWGGGEKTFSNVHSLKGGERKVLPCFEGGCKKFQTRDFPIL